MTRSTPLLILLAWLVAAQAPAQVPQTPVGGDPAVPGEAGAHLPADADVRRLEAYVDGLMRAQLLAHDVAGATVAVVRDGELLFSRGYGWADVARRVPVDPARTLFRIGSITKLFTWTAVMQLVEAGELNLDADVNAYLDFRLPDSFEEPVTMRHLMTHTPGLEDRVSGLFAPPSGQSRGQWLRETMPARVRPPGQYAAYSNWGSALAGYVVERVSGLDWETYVRTRILEPLGMQAATAEQPVPEALAAQLSNGYRLDDGAHVAMPFEHVELAPAGSMSASAEAMAAFMIAHLQRGRFNDGRILRAATAQAMHNRTFVADPRISSLALGFYEKNSHGRRIIGHAGGTQWFFSDMALVPSEGLGIFVAFNSAGAASVPQQRLLALLLDGLLGEAAAPFDPGPPDEGWLQRAEAYAGTYRLLRRSFTTYEKLIGAFMDVRVEPVGPGELRLTSPLGTERLFEVEPGLLRTRDRSLHVAFDGADGGRHTHLYLGNMPVVAAARVPWYDSVGVHAVAFALSFLLLLSLPAAMPVRWLMQRGVAGVPPLAGAARSLRWVATAFVLLIGAFVVGVLAVVDQHALLTGESEPPLRTLLALPVVALVLLPVLLIGAVLAWRRTWWSTWGRTHFALVALAAVVVMLQLHHWRLLGWHH